MGWRGYLESTSVEDRRGSGNGDGKTPGIIGITVFLVGVYYGIDLSGLVGTTSLDTGTVRQSSLAQEEEKELAKMSEVMLTDTEATWCSYLSEKLGKTYTPARMVFYTGGTHTPHGASQATMEPFYCPGDHSVYLDLSFHDDMHKKLGASGETALAYVIAREVGHHVRNLLGILSEVSKVRQDAGQMQVNALSVKLELQTDCFAGVWGHYATGKKMLKVGGAQQAIIAAKSAGDDHLQQNIRSYVMSDSFTHGLSADCMTWPKHGLKSGDIGRCDTFTTN